MNETSHRTKRQSRHSNHKRKTKDYAIHTHRRHRLKRSYYIRNLFLFTGVILIMICIFFLQFWQYLADYQKSLPSMLGDEILTAYQNCDTSIIKGYCDTLPTALSDDLVLHTYLSKTIETKNLYYYENNIENKGNKITYTFCKGNQKFADLTVTKTGENSKYGFPLFKIVSLEQYPLSYYNLIQYPDTTIWVQNKQLDASYRTNQETLAACFDQLEAGPFYKNTYHIPDYLVSSELSATDSAKNTCDLIWDEEHTTCTASPALDDTLKQELTDFAESAAKTYAVFATVKYADKSSLLTYLYPDTDFYKAIKTYDNDWGITKTSDRFDAVSCTDFMKYSDTEYSCNVSFCYFVSQDSKEKEYPLNFTCYITYKNGKPQLVNLDVN